MTKPIRFIHISDTHIGPTKDFKLRSITTLPCAELTIRAINDLPFKPDFVLHSGDVTADPSNKAYKLVNRAFSKLNYPIYYVTGNHDTSQDIKKYLPMGAKKTFRIH